MCVEVLNQWKPAFHVNRHGQVVPLEVYTLTNVAYFAPACRPGLHQYVEFG